LDMGTWDYKYMEVLRYMSVYVVRKSMELGLRPSGLSRNNGMTTMIRSQI